APGDLWGKHVPGGCGRALVAVRDYRTGWRMYSRRAHTYPSSAIPAHQATAMIALWPIGVPRSSPRTVSVTGVKGWYSANQRTPAGIESVGTKPLPRNGSSSRNIGRLLAVSTLLLTRPRATDSQTSAKLIIAMTPIAATHSAKVAVGRNPMGAAIRMTTATLSMLWIKLPRTWPVSTEERAMAMVRNRAMMPSVMSMATDIAVACAAVAT